MEEAISKAAALLEAHEYIRRFQGKRVVVKVGGSIMDQPENLKRLLEDVCFMHAVGMSPIVVHGGGKAITQAMQQAGLQAQFVHGRRYTDERTLAIAEHVLVNDINQGMVDVMRSQGSQAMGVHSLASCAVFAQKMFLEVSEGTDNAKIDLGHVGEVDWVNHELLLALTAAGLVPVIAPIARDKSGGKLNVNADSVAGHVAAAIRAEKLVLVSDTHGIRTTNEENGDFASHLTREEIEGLVQRKIIDGGMLPKVEACLVALQAGVNKAHIVDGRIPHSLLLEVYTKKGVGTEIVLEETNQS